MAWMNQYEVENAVNELDHLPNLGAAAQTLANLVEWTNNNSDGWPYWRKPSNASSRLQDMLEAAMRSRREAPIADASAAEIRKALAPIKAFRTRQGADFEIVSP